MTAAPPKKKRSAAQIQAGQAFAAGGQSAQANTRAAAIKATGKPPPRSKAQQASAQNLAKSGRAAQAAKKSGKPPPKKAAMPLVTSSSLITPMIWLPGCNDQLPTCGTVAVANQMLSTTGIIPSDADILILHEHAGGNDGATIENVLEAAGHHGLAGVKLASYGTSEDIWPGMVVGVQTRRGYHAVLSHEYGLISWGLLMPRFGEPGEAWALEWDLDHV
jgi:hypothetical protein